MGTDYVFVSMFRWRMMNKILSSVLSDLWISANVNIKPAVNKDWPSKGQEGVVRPGDAKPRAAVGRTPRRSQRHNATPPPPRALPRGHVREGLWVGNTLVLYKDCDRNKYFIEHNQYLIHHLLLQIVITKGRFRTLSGNFNNFCLGSK